jgi:hypothetical protein
MPFDLLSDVEERMDLARNAEAAAVEVLAETISKNDPASQRYQAGLRDDTKKDRWSIVVTEFTSSILAPSRLNAPSYCKAPPLRRPSCCHQQRRHVTGCLEVPARGFDDYSTWSTLGSKHAEVTFEDRVFEFVMRDPEAEFGYDEGERVARCLVGRENRRPGQTRVDL